MSARPVRIADTLKQFGAQVAYGEEREIEGTTFVPVALVGYGFGGGRAEVEGGGGGCAPVGAGGGAGPRGAGAPPRRHRGRGGGRRRRGRRSGHPQRGGVLR